ncbi:MAG: DUF616 domain-containing protein [Candidatus Eremiobacteraeota bacterium]|nr:DUF616 domain-containing protein [Candidatus Eremiobacteraeota bacterium]
MKLSVITPTHDTTWLRETWESLKLQTHTDFEWVVLVNDAQGDVTRVAKRHVEVRTIVDSDPRVQIYSELSPFSGVGARKKIAFDLGVGEVLIELDHDDLLLPNALEEIAQAFENPEIGFAYSDFADFDSENLTDQGTWTYRHPEVRQGWIAGGSTFYDVDVKAPRPMRYEFCRTQKVTAKLVSTIYQAPNHVRAWRRSVYHQIGGHNPAYRVCDDHELMLRTYLVTRMHHIEAPLYLYRISGRNTWAQNIPEIQRITYELQAQYIDRLVLRECELLGLPAYDLGGALDPAAGWKIVDIEEREDSKPLDVKADLMQRWPFEDNSVGAFRAHDFLEHIPDRLHTLREIHRCLRPGGWLLSFTPSTDGRGAWQDPTHCSLWNENAWWYHLRGRAQTKYVRRDNPLFDEVILKSWFPSDWHRNNAIPYVTANVTAWKPPKISVAFEVDGKTFDNPEDAQRALAARRSAPRVVVYTAIYGKHTDLKSHDTSPYPFVCFTDDEMIASEDVQNAWDVRVLASDWMGTRGKSPRLQAKRVKLFPPDTLPKHDVSIWIDASIRVTDTQKLVDACLAALGDNDIAVFKHPERNDVLEEAKASSKMKKYDGFDLCKQAEHYHSVGLPTPSGLYAGGVIARRSTPRVRKLMEHWWGENVAWSPQDQISFPFALWKLDMKTGLIAGNVYGSEFHTHEWTGPDR